MSQRFFDAIKAGELAQIEELLSLDPNLASMKSEGGTSAVLVAAYNNQAEIARLLAAHGGVLNIFEAAAVGDLGRARQLIQRDAKLVNAYAADGFQPLGLASFFGHLKIAELLLSNGAEVDSPSDNNMRVRPLHSAVAHRHVEVARLLISHGADVNAPQRSGFTPLQGALRNGQVEMIELLLEHGADPDLPGAGGLSPRQEAESGKQRGMAALVSAMSYVSSLEAD